MSKIKKANVFAGGIEEAANAVTTNLSQGMFAKLTYDYFGTTGQPMEVSAKDFIAKSEEMILSLTNKLQLWQHLRNKAEMLNGSTLTVDQLRQLLAAKGVTA